jgi:hypothetical protein
LHEDSCAPIESLNAWTSNKSFSSQTVPEVSGDQPSETEVAAIICSHPFLQALGERVFVFHNYVLDVLNTTLSLEIELLKRQNAALRARLRAPQKHRRVRVRGN